MSPQPLAPHGGVTLYYNSSPFFSLQPSADTENRAVHPYAKQLFLSVNSFTLKELASDLSDRVSEMLTENRPLVLRSSYLKFLLSL